MALAGCATSTIESRRNEKFSSYSQFPPEIQQLVDSGQIKVGMPADAVYIAWGAPSDVLQSEDEQGSRTTWLYHDSYMEERRFWNYREVQSPHGSFLERFLDTEYSPRRFIRAEITFEDGVVKQWRTLPRPDVINRSRKFPEAR